MFLNNNLSKSELKKIYLQEKSDILKEEQQIYGEYEEYRTAIKDKYKIDIENFKASITGSPIKDFNIRDIVKFPLKEVLTGMEVETEHTSDYMVALEITIAHMKESGKYYTYLDQMETRMKKSEEIKDKIIEG
jgi:hypothetical protein